MSSQPTVSVTFLGTSSGGGPSETRNCSSLVVDGFGDGTLWMVDCAEGTVRQIVTQPTDKGEARIRTSRISKVFITHMHADHIMGLITLLRDVLRPPWENNGQTHTIPHVEIYGPAGLRSFVRSCLAATRTRTAFCYAVHELLTPEDDLTPCGTGDLHASELPGHDILSDDDGFWREIVDSQSQRNRLLVDAGPIIHRDPCVGYIMREPKGVGRKLVILGDTLDPSALVSLIESLPGPPPTLLVHEATDCFIPSSVDPRAHRSPGLVEQKCQERGHSTPVMAGTFARRIGAEHLVMNHIGSRFPAAPKGNARGYIQRIRQDVVAEIERQATEAWASGRLAIAAYDYLRIDLPPYRESYSNTEETMAEDWSQENDTGDWSIARNDEVQVEPELIIPQHEVVPSRGRGRGQGFARDANQRRGRGKNGKKHTHNHWGGMGDFPVHMGGRGRGRGGRGQAGGRGRPT